MTTPILCALCGKRHRLVPPTFICDGTLNGAPCRSTTYMHELSATPTMSRPFDWADDDRAEMQGETG